MLRDLSGPKRYFSKEEVERDAQYFNSAFARKAVEFERNQKRLIFKVPSKGSDCSVNQSVDSIENRRIKVQSLYKPHKLSQNDLDAIRNLQNLEL